jgi:hypothetical protein
MYGAFFWPKITGALIMKEYKQMEPYCVLLYVIGSADEVDHTAVGAAITTITTNLPEMTRGVRMIAALMDDDSSGEKLLDAARKLCTAFSDLLKAAEPETKEVFVMLGALEQLREFVSTAGVFSKYH